MVLLGTGGALAGGHVVTQAEKLGIYAGMPLSSCWYCRLLGFASCWTASSCLLAILSIPGSQTMRTRKAQPQA